MKLLMARHAQKGEGGNDCILDLFNIQRWSEGGTNREAESEIPEVERKYSGD